MVDSISSPGSSAAEKTIDIIVEKRRLAPAARAALTARNTHQHYSRFSRLRKEKVK